MEYNQTEISLCCIYKNEEKNLPEFLERHFGLFDEYVFVDTGSDDKSNEILNNYGIKPLFYAWDDDFSNARNFSIKNATKGHILVLDIDEYIETEDIEALKVLINKTNADVFSLNQINFVNTIDTFNWYGISTLDKKYHGIAKGFFLSKIFRFFKNIDGIEYRGIIHENIGDSVKELDLKTCDTEINIYHTGWLEEEGNSERLKKKKEWYEELIKKEFEKNKSAKNVFYYLTTIDSIDEKIKISYKYSKIYPKVYQLWVILSRSYLDKGDPIRALKYSEKGLEYNANNIDLLFTKAKALNILKRYDDAIVILNKLLINDEFNPNFLREMYLSLKLSKREEEANEIIKKLTKSKIL